MEILFGFVDFFVFFSRSHNNGMSHRLSLVEFFLLTK